MLPERFGGIDYLVNNAAIYGTMRLDLLLTVDWDYYKHFMGVNMDGVLVCTRACYPHMAARGGGAIVNQSSTAAWLYSMVEAGARPAASVADMARSADRPKARRIRMRKDLREIECRRLVTSTGNQPTSVAS